MNFDVVITTRQRPELLKAAIDSCLLQGEALHRVIVVFDPDDDVTAGFAATVKDPRVVFHRLSEQGGICCARRAGLAIADAEWMVHIDDDWELRPGALARLAEMAAIAPEDVVMVGARILWTNNRETPQIVPENAIDYVEQLKWRNRPHGLWSDNLCCLHKKVKDSGVNWMHEVAGECTEVKFFLDAARCGSALYTSELLAIEKPTLGCNSRGTWFNRLARRKEHAASYLRCLKALIDSHGPGLRRHAKKLYGGVLRGGAMSALLLDRQKESIKLAGKAFAYSPSRISLGMFLLACAGRRFFEVCYRIRG
jgi:glycosyltransferase involved in cell wall biosynthesis